jgi:parallel beta-helix repeat protein
MSVDVKMKIAGPAKKITTLFIISCCIFTALSVSAATYYVDPNGSDRSPGTQARPWASLQRAASTATSGDTVLIKGGTYPFNKRVTMYNDGPITFQAYPGEEPVFRFTGSDTYAVSIGDKADQITIHGLTLVWATNSNGNILGIGGEYATIKNCHIYFDSQYSPTNYDCIKILSTSLHATVEQCNIHGAPEQGIDTVGGDNLVVRNNTIHDCQNAIVLKGGSDDNLIEDNTCYNLRFGAIGLGGTTGEKFINYEHENTNTVVRRNTIYYDNANNIGGGIFLQGAKGCLVHNNTLYGPGIHLRTGGDPKNPSFFCSDNQIANNIIWKTGNDAIIVVETGNSSGLELRNNLYWKTKAGAGFKVNNQWYVYAEFKSIFSFDHDSLFQDPLFQDVSSRDFSLSGGSPCVNNGYPIDQQALQGARIDIGALEYRPMSPPKDLSVR